MRREFIRLTALCIAVVLFSSPAMADGDLTLCRSQQSIEQVMETDGQLDPDDCRPARITRLDSDAGPVCVLNLSDGGGTFLGDLREMAETGEWWLPCDALRAALDN
jgi:hypothetical protein